MMNRQLLMVLALLLLLSSSGCEKDTTGTDRSKVLARINKYELTTDDFRNEARLTLSNKNFSGSPDKASEELLNEMITKKILLEEAQRQDFDKDKAFMKEIERYWEQALLKLLVKQKMDELSRGITVTESEMRDEYDRLSKASPGKIAPFNGKAPEIRDDIYKRKMQASLDEWLRSLREKASVTIYKENL